MKISAVAACLNSFSFLSDHGMCHTHLFYIQSWIPSLAMSVVMFVSELLSGTFPSDVFLKTCQGWRFTLKMVRHQKGPFLIRARLIILGEKKNFLWLVWSQDQNSHHLAMLNGILLPWNPITFFSSSILWFSSQIFCIFGKACSCHICGLSNSCMNLIPSLS